MKRFIIAAVLSLVIATSFANDNSKVSAYVTSSFKVDFPGAADVQWSLKSEYNKAEFTYEGKKTQAYYTAEGKFIGVGQVLSVKDIPAAAAKKIGKKYADYTISDVISFEQAEQAKKYYVSVENASEKIILEVNDDASLTLFKKTAK